LEDDICAKDYNFTDGCGEISPDLMEKICTKLDLEDTDEMPSVIQA
jgi:hypothetical protein